MKHGETGTADNTTYDVIVVGGGHAGCEAASEVGENLINLRRIIYYEHYKIRKYYKVIWTS